MQVAKTNSGQLFIFYSIVTLLLVLALYALGLKAPFQFDDIANITKNFSIRNFNVWSEIMSRSRWFGELTNKLYFRVAGFNPVYYRIFNLFCHMTAGIGWLLLCHFICAKQKISTFIKEHAFVLSNISFAFFMLHPVQTQTVSYIIQARLEGLATLFIIGSLFCLFMGLLSTSSLEKKLFIGLAFFTQFLACGSKEIAIVTPVLAILVDIFWFSNFSWKEFKPRLVTHALYFGFTLFLMIQLLKPSFFIDLFSFSISSFNNRGNLVTELPTEKITAYQFFISEFQVLLHYLWIYICPFNICVDYDFKLYTSFLNPEVILSFFTLVGITGFFTWLIQIPSWRALSFGYFWFLIAMAPRTTFIPCAELVCDYKTYLASFGIFWMIGFTIVQFCTKIFSKNRESKQTFITISLLSLCALMTFQRNKVWADAVVFWEDIVKKNPGKARPLNNLGVALTEQGRYEEAVTCYRQAIEKDKYYPDPLSNLAVTLSTIEKYDEAILALHRALEIIPEYAEAYNNLAALYVKTNEIDRAIPLLKKAIEIRPFYGKAFFNLGRCYLLKENKELAWNCFKSATKGDLDNAEGFSALGQASMMVEKYEEAKNAFITAIKKGDQTFDTHFHLANSLYMLKDFLSAEQLYRELLKANSNNGNVKFNLAEALFMQEKYVAAHEVFVEFLKYSKEIPMAIVRAAHCLEKIYNIDKSLEFLETCKELEFTPEGKELFKNELGRARLQVRINSGNGTVNKQDMDAMFSI